MKNPEKQESTRDISADNYSTDSYRADTYHADSSTKASGGAQHPTQQNGLESQPGEFGYTTVPAEGTVPSETVDSVEGELTLGVFIRETLQVVLPALALAVIIHLFLAQATVVYGSSMQPILREKQRLVVDKLTYRFRDPIRNDIVVLDLDNVDEMLVKRVIGLPGETMDVRGGNIYIDNEPLREQIPHELSLPPHFPHPIELGPSEYYVLGDNRSNSNDSRAFGSIHRTEIVGKIWLRYWPLTELKLF